MTTILAFDAGPRWTGFARVQMRAGRPVVFVFLEGMKIESRPDVVGSYLSGAADLVAVEGVEGYPYDPVRGAALIATNGVATAIEWLARARSLAVERLSARGWRAPLCGRANAGDHEVARAVAMHVRGLPQRTNEHVRDALGLAIVAGWRPLAKSRACGEQIYSKYGSLRADLGNETR